MKLFFDDGRGRGELTKCPFRESLGGSDMLFHCGIFSFYSMVDGLRCGWPSVNPPKSCPVLSGKVPEYNFVEAE